MKLKEVLDRTVIFFKDKRFETPRLDAELLLAHGLGLKNRIDLYLKFEQPLSEIELSKCRELVKRRSSGEPVAYIIGKKDFLDYTFQVNSNVLIPRPETEQLVELAHAWAKSKGLIKFQILDIGTGSGCIAVSLAKKIADSEVVAIDSSESAIVVARSNAEKLGVLERIRFINKRAEDINELDGDAFDIVVANPPYIAIDDLEVESHVKAFEPSSALFADDNGLRALKDWSKKFSNHLKSEALMVFEMGYRQGEPMQKHFQDLGIFSRVEVIKDMSGHPRFILGERAGKTQ
jgi:release factor glutamine methyltransferase